MLKPVVLHELNRVVHNDDGVHVHGPVTSTVDGLSLVDEIKEFRRRQYLISAPHLISAVQQSIEARLQLEQTGTHFFARHEGATVASLRVTPPPFELSALSPQLQEAVSGFPRSVELGRLLVDSRVRGMGLGKKVLYRAMLWACTRDYDGFIAICREHRLEEFRRFGMRQTHRQPFQIPSRPDGRYYFLQARWGQIVRRVARHYGSKRLMNVLAGKPASDWRRLALKET